MGLKVCNLANAASLLWHGLKALPEPSNRVNWAGFYVRDGPDNLILGPFQGRVACQTISFSRGVCGRAARTAETQIVDDVHSDVSHVACDSSTKSEIVVPILFNGEVSSFYILHIDRSKKRERQVWFLQVDAFIDWTEAATFFFPLVTFGRLGKLPLPVGNFLVVQGWQFFFFFHYLS
ncbi:hypothetical protein TWF751_012090 [Orbilia oligospora]|nr:hypothetical protein TWF751_012090 [Orbilia oligospora]